MKFIYLFITLLITTTIHAQIFQEDFTTMTVGNAPSNGWSQCSASGTNAEIDANNLTYLNYYLSNNSNCFQTLYPFAASNLGGYCKSFTNPGGSVVYASFLLNCSQIPWTGTTSQYFFTIGNSNIDNAASVFFKRASANTFNLGIRKGTNAETYSTTTYNTGTTYLVIIKYKIVAGATNDIVSMFINPVVGQPEPAATVSAAAGGADVTTTIQNVFIRMNQLSSAIPPVEIDAIRVDTSWSNVLNGIAPTSCNAMAKMNASTTAMTVYCTNTSTGVYTSSLWNFGDGTTSTSANISHTYFIPGIYNICLKIYNGTIYCDSTCTYQQANYYSSINNTNKNITAMFNSQEQVFIQSTNTSNGMFRLISMDGRILMQQKEQLVGGINKINIPYLPKGLYLAQWVSKEGTFGSKLNW